MVKKLFAFLLALVSIGTAVFTVHLCNTYRKENPMLLTPPHLARSKVVSLMNAVCDGDFDKASQCIMGTPSLGIDRDAEGETGSLIWKAYLNSISFELVGDCYTTDSGLAQKISITSMDISSVTKDLNRRAQELLVRRVAEAQNPSEVYDENNNYQEAFVMAVLGDAVRDALREDARMHTVELTVKLGFQDGTWWVIADNELLDAISGGVLY